MRLNIENIPEDGLQEEFDLSISLDNTGTPIVVHSLLKIVRIGSRILIDGSAVARTYQTCSRCLNEFTYPVDIMFSEEYIPAESSEEGSQETDHRNLDFSFYTNDEINLLEVIREQVLLTMPIKPLCSSACRGLCPACGRDLNQGTCQCRQEGVDPRLAPLERLREQMKERKE